MSAVLARSFYIEMVQNVPVVCFRVRSIVEQTSEFVVGELSDLISTVVDNGATHVVFDLRSVREIDDWGLALLRSMEETMRSHDGNIILCRPHSSVTNLICHAGLNDDFRVCDTLKEAIWGHP